MSYMVIRPAEQAGRQGWPGPQQCINPAPYWAPGTSPDDVSALAARLSRLAGEIDNARARLCAATALEWASKAGDAFRGEAALRAAALAAASADVRTASGYVAAYARALESLAAAGPGLLGG